MTIMVSPGLGSAFFEAANDAGQGFGESGVFEGNAVGNEQSVLLDDTGWDADVFGVGSVVEEEVFAEILLAVAAEETDVAGGRVEGNDPVAFAEVGDAGARLRRPLRRARGQRGWAAQHHGVVAAAVDLQVGAAGQGGADANHQFPGRGLGDRHLLQPKVFLAVQDRGRHLRDHPFYLLIPKVHSASPLTLCNPLQ